MHLAAVVEPFLSLVGAAVDLPWAEVAAEGPPSVVAAAARPLAAEALPLVEEAVAALPLVAAAAAALPLVAVVERVGTWAEAVEALPPQEAGAWPPVALPPEPALAWVAV